MDLPLFQSGPPTSAFRLRFEGKATLMQVHIQNDVVQFTSATCDIVCTCSQKDACAPGARVVRRDESDSPYSGRFGRCDSVRAIIDEQGTLGIYAAALKAKERKVGSGFSASHHVGTVDMRREVPPHRQDAQTVDEALQSAVGGNAFTDIESIKNLRDAGHLCQVTVKLRK